MTTTAQPEVGRSTGTRISSYLLVEYPGTHRRRRHLWALRPYQHRVPGRAQQEPHPLPHQPARAGVGAFGRRLRARHRQAGRGAQPPRARPDQLRDRRGERRARFDPDGGDCRRHSLVLPRAASAPGSEPAPGRRPVADLPAVLQARLPRRSCRRSARASWNGRFIWRPTAGRGRCWSTSRWTSSPPTFRPTRSSRCPRKSPARHSTPRPLNESSRCSPKRTGR